MDVKFAYYRESVTLDIPEENLIGVLRPEEIHPARDLRACISENLDHPIGTKPFRELCAGKKKICLVICDLTRPMETEKVLPVFLEQLEQYAPQAEITILIALGTHRPLSGEEIDKLCGPGVREKYRVVNHAFHDPAELVQIPCDRADVPPVFVNRLLVESDLRLAIGAVKPHPIFGWSGGAKIVIPGVAGYETTGYSHWLSCPHRGVEVMGLVDNPVRQLYESIVVEANLIDFILNAVLTEESRISDVRCGDIIQAHRAAVKLAEASYIRDVAEPADAIIVGTGKWAADLWVGSNAVYQSEFYLRKGGTIVLLGNFPEGISPVHKEIAQYGYLPYREVRKLVEGGPLADDLSTASHLVHLGRVLDAREAECVLLSEGIGREEAQKVGFRYLDSPAEIMGYLKRKHGENLRVLAIPGYNSTPIISSMPQP